MSRSLEVECEQLHGSVGSVSYDVSAFHERNRMESTLGYFALKGGLTDITSATQIILADEIVRQSNGDFVAGIVATNRPKNLLHAFSGIRRARIQRSQSMKGALDHGVRIFQPELLIAEGHSEGGITAVDGAVNYITQPTPEFKLPTNRMMVFPIDTPGIYEKIPEGNLLGGLLELGAHCLPDLNRLDIGERVDMLRQALKGNFSLRELAYIVSEIDYIQDIELKGTIGHLRNRLGVDVYPIFHSGDLVPGAQARDRNKKVFEGGHMRIATREGAAEVARYMLEIAYAKVDEVLPTNYARFGGVVASS